MTPRNVLKIALDARCTPGKGGGVSQAVMSLINTLGNLDGPEAYTIVVDSSEKMDWLQKISGPNQQFVVKPASPVVSRISLRSKLRKRLAGYRRKLMGPSQTKVECPISDGFFESTGCDLIHFPTQKFVLCELPSIYNPHDLQHLHYPEFFTASQFAKREAIYRAGCHYSHTVVVGSQWVKDDVLAHYSISPDKVQVIPEHPPTPLTARNEKGAPSVVRDKYELPPTFGVYPAVSWPHKNHLRLFEALAHLRDTRGLTIRLVCTGARDDSYWPRLEERINDLRLHGQVKFLGFVSDADLKAIYRLAQFLVMPTLFEASSLPIFEAWAEGTPVTCSRATALPDQVMDAALMFDPNDVMSIADAISRMTIEPSLRDQLRSKGYRRLKDFDWERTAKAYRAVYRRSVGRRLSEEDRWLLSWDWMRNPDRRMEVA